MVVNQFIKSPIPLQITSNDTQASQINQQQQQQHPTAASKVACDKCVSFHRINGKGSYSSRLGTIQSDLIQARASEPQSHRSRLTGATPRKQTRSSNRANHQGQSASAKSSGRQSPAIKGAFPFHLAVGRLVGGLGLPCLPAQRVPIYIHWVKLITFIIVITRRTNSMTTSK